MVEYFRDASRATTPFLEAWAAWPPKIPLEELSEDDQHRVKCAAATLYEDSCGSQPQTTDRPCADKNANQDPHPFLKLHAGYSDYPRNFPQPDDVEILN